MKHNIFKTGFDEYAVPGDTIEAQHNGLTITARLVDDDTADSPEERDEGFWPSKNPDDHGYIGPDHEQFEQQWQHAHQVMEQWRNGDWLYVGVVLDVAKNGITIANHAASLWGLECNYPKNPYAASADDDYPNNYLTEVANELADEALKVARRNLATLADEQDHGENVAAVTAALYENPETYEQIYEAHKEVLGGFVGLWNLCGMAGKVFSQESAIYEAGVEYYWIEAIDGYAHKIVDTLLDGKVPSVATMHRFAAWAIEQCRL